MRTVEKFRVSLDSEASVMMPELSKVITAILDPESFCVDIFAETYYDENSGPDEHVFQERNFVMLATGEKLPDSSKFRNTYIATIPKHTSSKLRVSGEIHIYETERLKTEKL